MLALSVIAILAACQPQSNQDRLVRELLERLQSEEVDVRAAAYERLKGLGSSAIPGVKRLAEGSDPETAGLARRLLQVIPLVARLPPSLLVEFPGLEERVVERPEIWSGVLRDMTTQNKHPALRRREVEAVVLECIRRDDDLSQACQIIIERRLAGTIPELRKKLQSPEAELRRQVVVTLAELGDPESASPIAMLLNDNDVAVRASAAWALRWLKARDLAPRILPLLQDADRNVRWVATCALTALGAKDALLDVRKSLQDSDWHVRGAALEALVDSGLEEAKEALVEVFRGDVRDRQRKAGRSLVRMGARTQFLRLLEDSVPGVRRSAALWIGELGGKEGVPELRRLVREARDPEAAEELYRLGEKDAQECLLAGLTSRDPEVRYETIWTVWELGADETAPQILPLLADSDSDVRRSAARVLADMHCKESVPWLIRLLSDRQVRAEALESLAALGSDEAKGEALKWIKEGKAASRSGAIAAGRLGLHEALDDLEKLRSHPDPDVRLASCEALGLLGGTPEAGRVVKSLGDENWKVVEGALRGLKHLGEKAAPPLLKLLEEGSTRERQIAIEALGRIGARSTVPSLIRHLEDPITAVRIASASELCRLGVGDGVPLLLEERANLTYLNALADPEAWKRLTDRIPRIHRPTTVHEGSWKSWFVQWGEEQRIPVQWQAGSPGLFPSIIVGGEYHPGALLPASEVPEQLSQWTDDGRFAVILEPAGLRIVPYVEGHRYWSRWLALNRK